MKRVVHPDLELKVWHFIFFILVLGVIIFIFSINYKTDCGEDQSCFLDASKNCRSATVEVKEDNNAFKYQIIDKEKDSCIIEVTATEVYGDPELVALFSGKQMICTIPNDVLSEQFISDVPDLTSYCTGELKEAMYEFIIGKIYGAIAQNLGDILSEIKDKI